eukprot:2897881-Amphidinium_carterae.2
MTPSLCMQLAATPERCYLHKMGITPGFLTAGQLRPPHTFEQVGNLESKTWLYCASILDEDWPYVGWFDAAWPLAGLHLPMHMPASTPPCMSRDQSSDQVIALVTDDPVYKDASDPQVHSDFENPPEYYADMHIQGFPEVLDVDLWEPQVPFRRETLRMATHNVRTLEAPRQGQGYGLQTTSRQQTLHHTFFNLGLEIVCLQETKLQEECALQSDRYETQRI